MRIILILLLICASFSANAEYVYTKPNYELLDKNMDPVPDVSTSTDLAKCLWKASSLPTGTYYCARPNPAKIKVTNNAPPTDPPEDPPPEDPPPPPPEDPPGEQSALFTWKAPTKILIIQN